jgi:hypothetical protein
MQCAHGHRVRRNVGDDFATTVLPFALAVPVLAATLVYATAVSLRSAIAPMRDHFPMGTRPAPLTVCGGALNKSPSE